MIKNITKGGYLIIRIITGILAGILFIYAFFTIWDMYRTEINAFATYDLLKYRPDIEHDKPPYLDELVKINPDAKGWITLYGTNIDYPIMKGKNDNEYLNKSATGENTVSGSIFLSHQNKEDFSDPYILLYGHHMENGSMFGDLDKFNNKNFFYNKKKKRFKKEEGVLIMPNCVWNLKVFAFIETSAYNNKIYWSDKTQKEIPDLLQYLKKESKHYKKIKDIDKVLALSTCVSATTDKRIVLLCRMKIRTEPLPTREKEPLTPHRKAIGHPMAGAYWGFMNFICLLITIYTVIKLNLTKRKQYIKILIEFLLMCLSIVLFILTENLHKPLQIIDKWTIPMILILVGVYFVEFLYQKKNVKEEKLS